MNKKNKGKMNRTLEVQGKEIPLLENSLLHPGKNENIKKLKTNDIRWTKQNVK